MEDVRTDVVVDWPTYIKDNFNNLNNGREPHAMTNGIRHGNTRRSMDNLLKVDTSCYGRGFQVYNTYVQNNASIVKIDFQ